MKNINLLIATLLVFTCEPLLAQLANPSFEGVACGTSVSPPSWSNAIGIVGLGSMDTREPSCCCPSLLATAGINYVCIMGGNNAEEPITQLLSPALVAGQNYCFSVDVYRYNLLGGADPAAFKLFGGMSAGAQTELLYSNLNINNTSSWVTLTATFTPTASYTHITISPHDPLMVAASGRYLCMDNLSLSTCVVAPIELLNFSANCTPVSGTSTSSVHAVRVAWSTATETNNDYFTIERSADAVAWETAGTVKGAGNSSTTLNYGFVDQLPSADYGLSTIYYRLTQTDFDGKTETFNNNLVAVDVTECAVKVFPNPAGNTLNVPYTAEQDGEITLQVYDVIGKLVKEKAVTATKGNNKFTLDLTTVAQGMYILKVNNGTVKRNEKFVKE